MFILTHLLGLYGKWRKRAYKKNWESDFQILLNQRGLADPFNIEGLELALQHLQQVSLREPSAQQRRTQTVYSASQTIEQLLAALSTARLLIVSRDTMPKVFFPEEECRIRAIDDYFTSGEGHVVSVVKISQSLEGRVQQLITTLRELEVEPDCETTYAFYNRKLRTLYRDAYYVLLAIHTTSYH